MMGKLAVNHFLSTLKYLVAKPTIIQMASPGIPIPPGQGLTIQAKKPRLHREEIWAIQRHRAIRGDHSGP